MTMEVLWDENNYGRFNDYSLKFAGSLMIYTQTKYLDHAACKLKVTYEEWIRNELTKKYCE